MTLYTRWVGALRYLDLTTDGRPTFSKIVCAVCLVYFIASHELTLWITVALLAASFGRSVFVAFLRSRAGNESPPAVSDEAQE